MNASEYVFIQNGELFMNISPEQVLNNQIIKNNTIHTNRTYREFLQKNALTIQESNFTVHPQELGNNIPYTFSSVGDNYQPAGYENSVPKQKYLSQQYDIATQTRPMFDSIEIERV